MIAGSLEAVIYEFFHFVDEIFHTIGLDRFTLGCHFCQWAHRKE